MSSLDLKNATESLLRTVFGSEFQTADADQQKARFAKSTIFVLTSIVFLVYGKVVGSYCCQKQDYRLDAISVVQHPRLRFVIL